MHIRSYSYGTSLQLFLHGHDREIAFLYVFRQRPSSMYAIPTHIALPSLYN